MEATLLGFLGQLGVEPSLYDSHILFQGTRSALWCFLCLAMLGLLGSLCVESPKKKED